MKKIRDIHVVNTLTRKKELLKTRESGKLTMYSCGPTVYGFIHIGNLRTAMAADLFYRYFKKVGYDVVYVRNFTDVDDKIIKRANEEKTTPDTIALKFTQEVEKDYALAGLLEPTHKTRATEHIPEMLQMIEALVANGKAYVAEGGEVLYAIDAFADYGKLSHRARDAMEAGLRVEVNSKKRNPLDFTLWKPAKPGEPSWPSPWGTGRPGWHIECSAMASKWLGECIDIHHGGADLIFPHHENEIAQSEGASGKAPFATYWLHSAFLTMSKEKMSKSLGNILTARDFLSKFSGEIARMMFLSIHYRSEADYGDEMMDQALLSLERLYEAKLKAQELSRIKQALPDLRAENLWGSFVAACEKARTDMDEQFANDFNTPGALGVLFTLIREFNRVAAEPKANQTAGAVLGAGELIRLIEEDFGAVMGVGRADPEKMLSDIAQIRASRSQAAGKTVLSAEEIGKLIAQRNEARKAKDFKRADELRNELLQKGVLIKDGPQGTEWKYD